MYQLKPAFQLPSKIELPANMYNLPQIQSPEIEISDGSSLHASLSDKESKVDWLALEKRWDNLLDKLKNVISHLNYIKETVQFESTDTAALNNLNEFDGAVIFANPISPPYSIILLRYFFPNEFNVNLSYYTHSSVTNLPNVTSKFILPKLNDSAINISIIWKKVNSVDCQLLINPVTSRPIYGEVNILRYIARLGVPSLKYGQSITDLQTDGILDVCYKLGHLRFAKERASLIRYLNAKLGKGSYFGGKEPNISDVAVWSTLWQLQIANLLNLNQDITQNMQKWYIRMDKVSNI